MSLTAFATVEDLESGWRTLSESEQAIAGELLVRATARLSALLRRYGVAIVENDEIQAYNLKTVTCNMVRRSMSANDVDGLQSMSQTIGSTTASVQWSNPDGTLYLSKSDKETLGLYDSAFICSIQAKTCADYIEEGE